MDSAKARQAVTWAAVTLLVVWGWLNGIRLTCHTVDRIRLLAGILFGVLILFRDAGGEAARPVPQGRLALLATAGAVLVAVGIIIPVHQFEWMGVILVVFSCLRWGLPPPYSANAGAALFMLYWAHPLPAQVMGPFTLWMQKLSVLGSEWLLQAFNVPAWVHGLILRVGTNVFEVPEACSGMRTVTAVLLAALGTGMFLRLRWPKVAALVVIGVIQVLALNIVRIGLLAVQGGPVGQGTAAHDRGGLILMVAIVLVVCEGLLWGRKPRHRARRHHSRRSLVQRGVSRLARRSISARAVFIVVLGLLLLAAGVFAGYRRRPEHRAAMVARVAESLLETDVAMAEAAAAEAARLMPEAVEYRLLRVRALLMRGKAEPGAVVRALAELDAVAGKADDSRVVVLRIWALSALGRTAEAEDAIGRLPERTRTMPGVAMTIAELAARRDDAEAVARHVGMAAASARMTPRIRALFPYLAARGQWAAIVAADGPEPHADLPILRLAVVASVKLGDFKRAATLLEQHRALWSSQVSFISLLSALALRNPDGPWTKEFADLLEVCLDRLPADEIAEVFDSCFALRRADLAWLAYRRLQAVDATHPALQLVPARHAGRWFVAMQRGFDDRGVVLPGLDQRLPAGMRGGGATVREAVPLAREMLDVTGLAARRGEWRRAGAAEVERRERDGRLSPVIAGLHVEAMDEQGLFREGHRMLDLMESRWPDRRPEILLRRARLHERVGDWCGVYECIRDFYAVGASREEGPELMLVNALMRLDLGPYALEVARRGVARYPRSERLRQALALVWNSFGCAEEALAVLGEGGQPTPDVVAARLLAQTGRREKAAMMWQLLKIPPAWPPPAPLRPAETVLEPPQAPGGSRKLADAAVTGVTNAFPLRARGLISRWSPSGDSEKTCDAWEALGRDNQEKASLLHRLACLWLSAGETKAAGEALRRACGHMPGSPMLWRLRIAVAGGDAGVVAGARQACSEDGDIWLAALVLGVRQGRNVEPAVTDAITKGCLAVGTLVRAGDFLLRAGHVRESCLLARAALARADGLPSAALLGLRCALAADDTIWAGRCLSQGLWMADGDQAFLKAVTRIAMDGGFRDASVVAQLVSLAEQFPHEPEWRERLGKAWLEDGNLQSARNVLEPLARGRGRRSGGVTILAAEACRRTGDRAAAIDILRSACEREPTNACLLNALVFTLAEEPAKLSEAKALVPKLLGGCPSAAALDTAAGVYRRSGVMDQAVCMAGRAVALALADPTGEGVAEIVLNAADIAGDAGNLPEARRFLREAERLGSRDASLGGRVERLRKRFGAGS